MANTSKDDPAAQTVQGTGLDKVTQDHLGEKMRADYRRTADKPTYLGEDASLPAGFEHQLLAIEKSEGIREMGVAAVGVALGTSDPKDDSKTSVPSDDTEASDRPAK